MSLQISLFPGDKKIVIKIYGCNFLKSKQKIKCHPAHVDYDFAKKSSYCLSDVDGWDVNFHLILSLSCKNDTKVFLKLLRFCFFFVKCNDESVSNRLNCLSSYGFRNKNSSFLLISSSLFWNDLRNIATMLRCRCVCAFFCRFLTRSYACRSGFVNNFFYFVLSNKYLKSLDKVRMLTEEIVLYA